MNRLLIGTLALFGLLTAALAGYSCSPRAVPEKADTAKPEVGSSAEQKPSETAWDILVKEAGREKRISVYSTEDSYLRTNLIKVMKGKFALELDMITGRAAELTPRLANERKAGIFGVDVYIGGGGSIINDMKPQGFFDTVGGQVFLAEVLDSAMWWGGGLIYLDKDRQAIAMVANPSVPVAINTNLVGREEIRSYLNLLNPKWTGKMIMNDPSTPGTAQFWFAVTSSRIMNLDYMRNLAKMEPVVTRDQRLQVEWVSQGKFPVAISPTSPIVSQFKKEGAPIEQTTPQEGTPVTSSAGNIALMNKAPHPKAAKLFINWLLTREGQTLFSQALGFQSARLDVPTGHLDSDKVRKPGVKYFSAIDEDFLKSLPEHAKMAREIFGPLMK